RLVPDGWMYNRLQGIPSIRQSGHARQPSGWIESILAKLLKILIKCRDHRRVEVRAGVAHDDVSGSLWRICRFINAGGGKGIVNVGQGDNSSGQWNLLSA